MSACALVASAKDSSEPGKPDPSKGAPRACPTGHHRSCPPPTVSRRAGRHPKGPLLPPKAPPLTCPSASRHILAPHVQRRPTWPVRASPASSQVVQGHATCPAVLSSASTGPLSRGASGPAAGSTQKDLSGHHLDPHRHHLTPRNTHPPPQAPLMYIGGGTKTAAARRKSAAALCRSLMSVRAHHFAPAASVCARPQSKQGERCASARALPSLSASRALTTRGQW